MPRPPFSSPWPTPHCIPGAFYKGLRLAGVDGTTLNVANTPVMKQRRAKTKARRGNAAFHRLSSVALVELGTHCPLALRIAHHDESESALAADIVLQLRGSDLLIADRYYGNGKWVGRLMALEHKPQFLLRVQERFGSTTKRVLPDGSKLVEVLDPDSAQMLLVREIKAKIRRPGRAWVKVRYWTSLLDHKAGPAMELVSLYAMRWEQEIAFREIKHYLHDDNLLLSHTVVTAIQEICALFIAQSIVADMRSDTSNSQHVPIMQVSFGKTLIACRHLCWLTAFVGSIITAQQAQAIAEAVSRILASQLSHKRRQRSCPRRVRQPINKWRRLMENRYTKGVFQCQLRK
jgi:hypothetical protein